MSIKKFIGQLHLWFGLLSGLVVFIVAITGALYVFQPELDRLVNREEVLVPTQNKPYASLDVWLDSAHRVLPPYASLSELRLHYNTQAGSTITVDARYREQGKPQVKQVLLNPYTGQILKAGNFFEDSFWGMVITLHVNLMLGEVGHAIVKYATLIFLLLLISGIFLWWPKNKAARRQRIQFRWRPGLSWKRKNYDLHNVLGFYACWIVVFMAITGLAWSFDWFKASLYYTLSGGETKRNTVSQTAASKTAPDIAQLVRCLHNLKTGFPAEYQRASSFYISYPMDSLRQQVKIQTTHDPEGVIGEQYTTFIFDRRSAAFVKKGTNWEGEERKNAGDWFNDYTYQIHVGSLLGLPSRLLVFFACLIVASLPITGFYIWLGRRGTSRRKKAQPVTSKRAVRQNVSQ